MITINSKKIKQFCRSIWKIAPPLYWKLPNDACRPRKDKTVSARHKRHTVIPANGNNPNTTSNTSDRLLGKAPVCPKHVHLIFSFSSRIVERLRQIEQTMQINCERLTKLQSSLELMARTQREREKVVHHSRGLASFHIETFLVIAIISLFQLLLVWVFFKRQWDFQLYCIFVTIPYFLFKYSTQYFQVFLGWLRFPVGFRHVACCFDEGNPMGGFLRGATD